MMHYNLNQLAIDGKLDEVPDALLTLEAMMLKDNRGNTPLHSAAFYGHLGQVPRLLTLETLLAKDSDGKTPIYSAIWGGTLSQVPEQFLTLETMLVKDDGDVTPIHYAAWFGHLNQVPIWLLTSETMLLKDGGGKTALQHAVERGHLDQLISIDFGDSAEVKEIVGEEWMVKHLEVLKQINELKLSNEISEVDLF